MEQENCSFEENPCTEPSVGPATNARKRMNIFMEKRLSEAMYKLKLKFNQPYRFGSLTVAELESVLVLSSSCDQTYNESGHASHFRFLLLCCGALDAAVDVKIAMAQKTIDTAVNKGVPLRISLLNSLLLLYLESGYQFSPVEFLTMLQQRSIAPDKLTYQRLLMRYCAVGDLPSASTLFEIMQRSSGLLSDSACNYLLCAYLKIQDRAQAESTLSIMRLHNFAVSQESFHDLACFYASVNAFKELNQVFASGQSCYAGAVQWQADTLLDVSVILAANKQQQYIATMLGSVKNVSDELLALLIDRLPGCLCQGRADVAFEISRRLLLPRISRPQDFLYRFFASMLEVNIPIERIVQFGKTIQRDGGASVDVASLFRHFGISVEPNSAPFSGMDRSTLVTSASSAVGASENFNETAKHPQTWSIAEMEERLKEILLSFQSKAGKIVSNSGAVAQIVSMAEQLVRLFRSSDGQANRILPASACMLMCAIHVTAKNLNSALSYHSEALAAAKNGDESMSLEMQNVFDLACLMLENGLLEDVLALLAKHKRSSVNDTAESAALQSSVQKLLHQAIVFGGCDFAAKILDAVLDNRLCRSSYVYIKLIVSAFLQRKEIRGAVDSFVQFARKGYRSSPVVTQFLYEYLIGADDRENLNKVFSASADAFDAGSSLFTLAMGYVARGKSREAQRILSDKRVQASPSMFDKWCHHFYVENKPHALLCLLTASEALPYARSLIYFYLAKTYAKNNNCEGALELLGRMQKENLRPNSRILRVLVDLFRANNLPLPFVMTEETASGHLLSAGCPSPGTEAAQPDRRPRSDALPPNVLARIKAGTAEMVTQFSSKIEHRLETLERSISKSLREFERSFDRLQKSPETGGAGVALTDSSANVTRRRDSPGLLDRVKRMVASSNSEHATEANQQSGRPSDDEAHRRNGTTSVSFTHDLHGLPLRAQLEAALAAKNCDLVHSLAKSGVASMPNDWFYRSLLLLVEQRHVESAFRLISERLVVQPFLALNFVRSICQRLYAQKNIEALLWLRSLAKVRPLCVSKDAAITPFILELQLETGKEERVMEEFEQNPDWLKTSGFIRLLQRLAAIPKFVDRVHGLLRHAERNGLSELPTILAIEHLANGQEEAIHKLFSAYPSVGRTIGFYLEDFAGTLRLRQKEDVLWNSLRILSSPQLQVPKASIGILYSYLLGMKMSSGDWAGGLAVVKHAVDNGLRVYNLHHKVVRRFKLSVLEAGLDFPFDFRTPEDFLSGPTKRDA